MLLRARWVERGSMASAAPSVAERPWMRRKFVLGWTGSSAPEGVLGYLASQSSAVEMTLVGGRYHALSSL